MPDENLFNEQLKMKIKERSEALLSQILKKNAAASVLRSADIHEGDEHGVEAYLRNMPCTTFDDIAEAVEAVAEAAEQGDDAYRHASVKLCGGVPWAFYTSSGTTGVPKRVPSDEDAFEAWKRTTTVMPTALHRAFPDAFKEGARVLCFSFNNPTKQLANGVPVGSLTSCGGQRLARESGGKARILGTFAWASPTALSGTAADALAMPTVYTAVVACQYHLLCALAVRSEVTAILDIFGSQTCTALELLRTKRDTLVADLRRGRLAHIGEPGWTELPASVHEAVDAWLAAAAPGALAAATDVLDAAALTDITAKLVFPQLDLLSCIQSGSFRKYLPRLRKLAGARVALIDMFYGSSESGLSGHNLRVGLDAKYVEACREDTPAPGEYVLLAGLQNYYEWARASDIEQEQPKLVQHWEVEKGVQYELVLTNSCGLFRYRTGDLFTCLGKHTYTGEHPVWRFDGREAQALCVSWEKTTEEALVASVAAAAKTLPGGGAKQLVDFMARELIDEDPGSYCIYIEVVDDDEGRVVGAFSDAFERAISIENPSYAKARVLGVLASSQVRLVSRGTFEALRDWAVAHGTAFSQYKQPLVVTEKKKALGDILEERVQFVGVARGGTALEVFKNATKKSEKHSMRAESIRAVKSAASIVSTSRRWSTFDRMSSQRHASHVSKRFTVTEIKNVKVKAAPDATHDADSPHGARHGGGGGGGGGGDLLESLKVAVPIAIGALLLGVWFGRRSRR